VSQSLHREIATSIVENLLEEYEEESWGDICLGIAWFLAGVGSTGPGAVTIDAIADAAKAISGAQHKDRLQ
jgi:hypothetical protein